jgi:hypothetical protein
LKNADFTIQTTAEKDHAEMRAALKIFPNLKNRLQLLSQLWPTDPKNEAGLPIANEKEQKAQQQEIIQNCIHACLPDLSGTERTVLMSRWKGMLDSTVDFSAFIHLLFSRRASIFCLLNSPEYRHPFYGKNLRQAIGEVLQALPEDPA